MGWDVSAETSRLRLRATAWRCLTSWSDESAAASEEPVSEVLPRAKVPAEESEFAAAVRLGLLPAEAPEPPRWDEREGMAASVVRRCGDACVSRRGRVCGCGVEGAKGRGVAGANGRGETSGSPRTSGLTKIFEFKSWLAQSHDATPRSTWRARTNAGISIRSLTRSAWRDLCDRGRRRGAARCLQDPRRAEALFERYSRPGPSEQVLLRGGVERGRLRIDTKEVSDLAFTADE